MKNKTFFKFIIFVALLNIAFIVSVILVTIFGYTQPYIAIFVTLFMFTYHIDVRIIVGFVGEAFRNNVKVDKKIYRVSKREYNFLCKLNVKKWKDRYITMFKDRFVLNSNYKLEQIETVLKNNISAETTHWFGCILAFTAIPLGWLISPDELIIYIVTSVLASVLDIIPIVIQRYNRYRLQILREKVKQKN